MNHALHTFSSFSFSIVPGRGTRDVCHNRKHHTVSDPRKTEYSLKRKRGSTSLTLLPPPLADLCRETSLDGRNGTPGSARIARDEVETVLALVQIGIRGTAGFASDVFHDVATEDVLNLLLLETTLDDQAAGSVNGTRGTQLSEQELGDVLVGTLHPLGNLGDVCKDSLALC
jgi:hypothetical protein